MEKSEIRVYLDETRHLKVNDGPMVLGGIWGPKDNCISFNKRIQMIKIRHGIPTNQELKWTKVSPAKIEYYKDVLISFLNEPNINYRGVIIDKKLINNKLYNLTDDDFYYRMQYLVMRNIASHRVAKYRLFFDYKDTWSNHRASGTVDYLKKTSRLAGNDFEFQPLRSDDVTLLQIADFLNGLFAYANSNSSQQVSEAKKELVKLLEEISGVCPTCNSPSASEKINILIWQPKVTFKNGLAS
ncbi:DUF3800 domain-containing protein [Candidatus Saccharibacteria bacterium]|nr:DUF3800 domain-containing protein [Candidatus Saccharibacteria bacterium]